MADYIAYLHQGKLLLCDEKDRLLESYGRLVCAREELEQVDRGYVVATRKSQYSTEALIRRRNDFKRLYPKLTVEPVTLDRPPGPTPAVASSSSSSRGRWARAAARDSFIRIQNYDKLY